MQHEGLTKHIEFLKPNRVGNLQKTNNYLKFK